MGRSILGAAVKRVEDPRFITGEGRYMADIESETALWMAVIRSDVPHGVLRELDKEDAARSPGVVAVYGATDLDVNPMPVGAPGLDKALRRPPIASDRVRFVGEVVGVVVAESERQAADAADLVWADIEPIQAVSTPEEAMAPGASLLYPELGSNVIYDRPGSDGAALSDADVVIETEVVSQRLAPVPLEPSGVVAIPGADGEIRVWLGSQAAHAHRRALSTILGLEESLVHVTVPDVGGGFGAKIALYPEQAICAAVALRLGRPVRWMESRTENLLGMAHGRAQRGWVRLGASRDGVLTGLAIEVIQDGGAYPLFGSYLPAFTRRMAAGPYLIPKIDFSWKTTVTNTTPVHAYRGAGRPEATVMLERAMDQLAIEVGLDAAEIRRRNFIPAEAFPHTTAVGERYDSGDHAAALELVLDLGGYDMARREQSERRDNGDRRLLGVGVASYVEITAGGGREDWGAVEVHPDDTATIYSGAVSHGQSHETTFAQIVSEVLMIPIGRLSLVQGDTGLVAHSGGTMGSRSLQIVGSTILEAGERVLHKARSLFAHHMEASIDDVVQFDDGRIGVAGVPSSGMTIGELAAFASDPSNLPEDMEPGLRGEVTWEQDEATFPFGSHLSIVEVDTETGDVTVLRHVACDDAGAILNRMVVDGQVHGGVAQGLGQALYEQFLYDGGNPLTGNMTTYLLPGAGSLPLFDVGHTETPTPENALGAKGIGEAGTIGSTPAILNAVIDALAPFGVRHLDMPLTPGKVWAAIRD